MCPFDHLTERLETDTNLEMELPIQSFKKFKKNIVKPSTISPEVLVFLAFSDIMGIFWGR